MGVKEEINEMFDALERSTDREDTPATEEPVADDSPKDEHKDDAPTTEAPADEPKTDAPSTTPPKEDDEVVRIKQENEDLRRKLAEKETKPVETKPIEKPPATDPPIADEDFIKDIDLDEVIREPSAFNKILNSIYKKAVTFASGEVKKSQAETLQTVPSMVISDIERQKTLKEMTDKFYSTNKDLEPFKKVVGVVFEELASQNPGKPLIEVLEKVGDETRKRLELKKPDAKPTKADDKDDPPPLPRKKGGRITQPKPDGNSLVSEIDAMNKVVRR